ncbi:MAG: hypothetical protein ACRECP_08635 [Methylocella sp.]
MKRDEIIVLAALLVPIALGTIIYATLPLFPFLIMFATEPAGTGCDEGPVTERSATNARGDVVEEYIKPCTGFGTVVDYSITLQLHGDEKTAKLVEHSELRDDYPKFRWIDDDTLMIDLGQVRSIWSRVDRVGSIHITYVSTKTEW